MSTPQPAFATGETPQPAFEYQQPADNDRSDDPGGPIATGFNQDTSFDGDNIPNANGPKPPVDRRITQANAKGVSQQGTGATGGRFSTGVDRHII